MDNELFRRNMLMAMTTVIYEMCGDTGKVFSAGLIQNLDLSVWINYEDMIGILANFDKVPADLFSTDLLK